MQEILFQNLALAFLPVMVVVIILFRWRLHYAHSILAIFRMLVQLLLIGYVLTYLFESDSALLVLLVLCVMIVAASWIALGTVEEKNRRHLLGYSLISILLGGGMVLLLITFGVLRLEPWYLPRFFIPLAGMIFANSMNSVSLAAERFHAEMLRGLDTLEARNVAFRAALIPITNTLFAVGLVSLPGMMTGQILSGIDPLVAVRYQIMVMCMVYGASGISAAIFLTMLQRDVPTEKR